MSLITEKELLKTDPKLPTRPYQIKALLSILTFVKCLVKMFCGTGKSRIITNVIIHKKQKLSVVVFPSLALITQYSKDYLKNPYFARHFKKHDVLNVSSEHLDTVESTTSPSLIKKFLKSKSSKIVLVTYQSLHVLLDCLEGKKIGLICYDEAHHVVSDECKKLVFGTDYYENEIYFTATPRNENGITMFDRDEPEKNMCGEIAYDYTYLNGLRDGFLNAFDICVDMYRENTNNSIYEAMSRAILARNTSRVLSFHSGVNGESNTNVWNFVNEDEFRIVFARIQQSEFPEKKGYYKKITFKGMDGETKSDDRTKMLKELDDTPDNEVYIISSCETIGEGVDTKKANMCVFADPKASITKIIQNIGRVLRRNNAQPLSTVLIPCFIDMNNYADANGDPIKQDEIIREQMRATNGDYAPILNVLAALKQEDPDIYDLCLKYPNRKAKDESLKEQGFTIADDDDDDGDYDYTPEDVEKMKTVDKVPLELHTDGTIERFNEEVKDQPLMRLYHDDETDTYKPIVKECDDDSDCGEDDRRQIEPPNPKKRGVGLQVHTNDEIEMLWRVKGELDFNRKFSCVVIECEVSANAEYWIMMNKKSCDYMDVYKKRPCRDSEDSGEATHSRWIGSQIQNYKNNRYIMSSNPEIRAMWKATMEKYKDILFIDLEKEWFSKKHIVGKFMDDKKHSPSMADKILEVRQHGKWISHQNENYKNKCGMMKYKHIRESWEEFKDTYKEYLTDNIEVWKTMCCDVRMFMYDKKKRPKCGKKKSKEQKMARWIGTQNQNFINNSVIMLNPEIRDMWIALNEDFKEYLGTRKELWKLAMSKFCDHMDDKHAIPLTTSKDPEIKKIRNWFNNQSKNYKNNKFIMSDPDIRIKWEEMLEKYKHIFNQEPMSPAQEPVSLAQEPPPKKKKRNLVIKPTTESASTHTHTHHAISDIGQFHKTHIRMRSDTLHQKFKDNPTLWEDYHQMRASTFANYDPSSIPSNRIIQELEKIKTKRQVVVVDMGCGKASIAHHFHNKSDTRFGFHNYDHQSGGDPMIQEIDISSLPLDDASAEYAIMSLALWGTKENCSQYIREAYRVLESKGRLYISDSTKKWSPEPLTPENGGELLRSLLTENGFNIISEDVGLPFCLFVCDKLY